MVHMGAPRGSPDSGVDSEVVVRMATTGPGPIYPIPRRPSSRPLVVHEPWLTSLTGPLSHFPFYFFLLLLFDLDAALLFA